MNIQTLRKQISKSDPGYVSFGGAVHLDLSGLDALGPLWCLDIEWAEVTSLPSDYDWSPLKYVGLQWHPCWAPVLNEPNISQLAISYAQQEALSLLDRKIENTEGVGSLLLDQPLITSVDRWFAPNFSCARVTIDDASTIDFGNAGSFRSIDDLRLQNIRSLANVSRFSHLGRLGIVVLEDTVVVDPKTFWSISATRIVVQASNRETVSWFYDVWDDRPVNWKDRIRFSGFIADDLYPEWSYIDVFEGLFNFD